MAYRTVCEVVWIVVWSFVLRAVSDIVCGAVSAVTARSPSSVVSQGIRPAAGQVTTGVMCRFTRPAIARITRHVILTVVPLVICDAPSPVVQHTTKEGIEGFWNQRVECER
jgi:hypothetical protein